VGLPGVQKVEDSDQTEDPSDNDGEGYAKDKWEDDGEKSREDEQDRDRKRPAERAVKGGNERIRIAGRKCTHGTLSKRVDCRDELRGLRLYGWLPIRGCQLQASGRLSEVAEKPGFRAEPSGKPVPGVKTPICGWPECLG
jgi:hypothetical protein